MSKEEDMKRMTVQGPISGNIHGLLTGGINETRKNSRTEHVYKGLSSTKTSNPHQINKLMLVTRAKTSRGV